MSWGEVEKLRAEQELGNKTSKGEDPGTLPVGGAVDDAGQPAVLASDASFLLPAVRKTPFGSLLYTKTKNFCRDRLATDIGKDVFRRERSATHSL
jgi:hypothetical protein